MNLLCPLSLRRVGQVNSEHEKENREFYSFWMHVLFQGWGSLGFVVDEGTEQRQLLPVSRSRTRGRDGEWLTEEDGLLGRLLPAGSERNARWW